MIYYSSDLLTLDYTSSAVKRNYSTITAKDMLVFTPNARTHLEVINHTFDNIIVVDSTNVPLMAEKPVVSKGAGQRNQIIIRKTWGTAFTPTGGSIGQFNGYVNREYINYMCRMADNVSDDVNEQDTTSFAIRGFARAVDTTIELQQSQNGCVEVQWTIDTSDKQIRKAIDKHKSLYLEDLDLMIVFNVNEITDIPDHPHHREVVVAQDDSCSLGMRIDLVLPEVGTYYMPINGNIVEIKSLPPEGRCIGLNVTLTSGAFVSNGERVHTASYTIKDSESLESFYIYTSRIRAEQNKDYCAFAKLESLQHEKTLTKMKQEHEQLMLLHKQDLAEKDAEIRKLEVDLKFYQTAKSHESKERDQAHEEFVANSRKEFQTVDIKMKRAEQRNKYRELKQKRLESETPQSKLKGIAGTVTVIAGTVSAVAIAYSRVREAAKQ